MSLADELLADFDDVTQEFDGTNQIITSNIKIEDENNILSKKSVFNVAKLMKSERAKKVLEKIQLSQLNRNNNIIKVVDFNPEYDLVVESNSLLADIDTEITIVYKYLKDIYNKRFPELESLVTSAYEYIHTVNYLGNVTDSDKLDQIDFLPPAIKMVVNVTASTTLGEKLADEEMARVNEACQLGFDLADAKVSISKYYSFYNYSVNAHLPLFNAHVYNII
uniref:U4/U6 small nuclear ribonucleoprotein Prp31 (Trinotate prediction) n=1 Tax=Henneguya salminicola TaxID=69463 RepID=A0A6G3MFJ9_HENSL